MTGENLLHAMAYIGADLVDEAEKRQFQKHSRRRWAGLAACVALIAGLGWGAFHLIETAAPVQEPSSMAHAEQNTLPTAPEYTPKEPEKRTVALVYQNYIYYLPYPLTPCGKLTEDTDAVLLGYVDEGQPLAGAACYYDRKYVNWAANGVPVSMLLDYQGEYYYAMTYGERADRTLSYTYEEAKAMTGETLYHTFVVPIESRALDETLTYTSGQNPAIWEQLALFGGIVSMEDKAGFVSRYTRADRWLPVGWDLGGEETEWELYVPAAEIQDLLDAYFDGCKFDPRALECYDSRQDTVRLDWMFMPYGSERHDFSTSLIDFRWNDGTQAVQIQIELIRTELEPLPEQNESGDISYQEASVPLGQKRYTIQFTEQGPKYLSIDWVEE
ncbi:MAG: hypothetical protein ACI4PT_05650 [Candidatus Avoscillospira sp.]